MEKLNILPAPTFAHLGVNYAERAETAPEKKTLTVSENTQQQVVQFISSDSGTTVTVGENASLKLVQVFTGECVSKLSAVVSDNARFDLIQLYTCGGVSETVTELRGHRAEFGADIGYDLGTGCLLDVNLIAQHCGRKTVSDINVSGVLRGDAKKTFKGTIDLRRGASGSKGSEKEDVILMDARAVNRTVPVILCDEEDVEGNHGATIGRIDEEHVFYMRSRGISEEKIYELVTRSRLARLIRMIGDEQAEKRIYDMLGWGDEVE